MKRTGPRAAAAARGGQAGAPGRHTMMRSGRHAEAVLDLARGVLGDHDDRIRAPGVGCRQRRIVAANLRRGPLGMVEEVEIVDGHDLRGPSRGHQQGCSE